MSADRIHFAGDDHRLPDRGSRGYVRVVARGCECSSSFEGEFHCDHGYTWSCDDCPVNDAMHALDAASIAKDAP